MRPRQLFPENLRTLGALQGQVLTNAQLRRGGLVGSQIDRYVTEGVLTRLDHRVYLLGRTAPTWQQWAWAGVLVGGRGARLMRRSAGAVLGLVPEALPIEVAVPSRLASREWARFVRETPGLRSPASTGAPARTLVPDTVLDLCAAAPDEAGVVHLLTTACQRQTTPDRVRRALARRSRLRHRALIEALLSEVADGVRSPLELRWVRDVERPHRLPVPSGRNVGLGRGGVPDLAYDAERVLIELDGRAYHREAFRDWRRDNGRSEEGWLTLRYGWHDVIGAGCDVAGNVGRVLQSRGWAGQITPCRLCVRKVR